MKKWLKTGKKALSVFMAVMMVLTAWVWVAPTEASAAAGTYDVKINWYVTDEMDSNGGTITLKTKGNNGTDSSATTHSSKSWVNSDSVKKNTWSQDFVWTGVGFPYSYNFTLADTFLPREMNATVHVYVRKSGSSDAYTEVGTHSFADWGDNTTHNDNVFTIASGKTPVATTFTWSNTPETMYCPKTGSATQTVAVTAVDQYGIQMYDPTWSVKGSSCGTSGISVTSTTTKSSSTTITLTNSGNNTSTTDTQTGTVTATWGSATSSKTFTIYDSYYTDTFNYKDADGNDTSATRSAYHGDTITPPSPPQYYDGDYLKTFSAWSPAIATTITKDVTYNATYTQQFIEADYTAVNNAISAANGIKTNYGTEYELKYTHASRTALDSAINAVVTGLGRTQQSTVDGYAQTINEKIAALEPNKFDVIFLDKDGAILLYEKDVEYKEAVTAPSYSDKYYDSTNHYTFTGWDTNEYTSVVDDLVIQPVFTAVAHTYTTSTVPSTCVQKGATKYTCSCGYSYVDGETDYGDHVWETEFTTDLEPTCTVAGSKSIHCTLCDAQKDITAIDPLGHNFTSQSVAVDATCGKIGIMTKVCDDCMFCEHTIIPALEHDYKETVVAPTCTTKGYTEYVCQRADCGHSYRDNYTDVTAHSYGAWETVSEAHCEVAGVKKRVCEDCGFTELGSIVALEHDSVDTLNWVVVIAPTCEGKGYKTKTCSKCNNVIAGEEINKLGHSYTDEVVDPTCTAKGYTKSICSTCGDIVYTDEKAALNHAWTSTTHAADCTHSAYIEHVCGNDSTHNYIEYVAGSTALGHNYSGTETIISAATCEADGKKTVKCTRCNETNTVIIPKLGHSYGAWQVVKEATNSEDGQWKRVCANNADHVEYVVIPKGGHTFDTTTPDSKTDATCTTQGSATYKCKTEGHTNCGVEINVTIPVKQHTIAIDNKEATCTEKGHSKTYCSVCTQEFNSVEIPVKAHDFVAQTAVAPSCTTSGYTPYTCSCGASYNKYNANEKATGHNYVKVQNSSTATCTAEGTITLRCSVCNNEINASVPALGHNYVEDTTAATSATCAAAATKTYKCSRCAASYTISEGDKTTEHTWGAWIVKESATPTSLGYQTSECIVCGQLKVETIPATGEHNFNTETARTPATCTDDGSVTYKCSTHTDCGLTSTVTIPATGHTEKLEYQAATCEGEGYARMVCSTEKCGAVLSEQIIPALGHLYGEGKVTNATCTTKGSIEYTCTRENCTDTKTVEIPTNANAHQYATVVTDATCTVAGSVVTECALCHDIIKNETLAVKGHDFTGTESDINPATCEADGSKKVQCKNCTETTTVIIPKLGHDWSDWTVTPSTNGAPGSVSRTCSRGCKEEVEIPAGGHTFGDTPDSTIPATCTTTGTATYNCTAHTGENACGVTITVTLDMLQHELETTEKLAKCEEPGEVVTKCKNCDNATFTTVIPATGHTYDDGVKTDATCTATGKIVYTCTADSCGKTKEITLEKLPHNYVAGTPVAATCTSSGYTPYKCATCTSSYVIVTADAKGHTFDTTKAEVSATCTTNGATTVKCDCGETLSIPTEALGHTYTKMSTTPATCAEGAKETYECSRCKDTYTVTVSSKTNVHDWSDWVTVEQATNTSLGYKTRTCKVCEKLEVETIPATGEHVFDTLEREKPADCENAGEKVYSCSTHPGETGCKLTSTVTIPATGHTEALDYKAASCKEEGYAKRYCTVCSKSLEEKKIEKLEHKFDNPVITLSDCKNEGKVEFTCAYNDCEETKTVTIPVNPDAHKLNTVTYPASCTKEGSVTVTCDNGCDYKKVTTLTKLQHNWGAWTTVKASTNTAEGLMERTCLNGCAEKETVAIPAGGHTLTETARENATCIKEGSVTFECKVNHTGDVACGVKVVVALPVAQHTPKTDSKDASCTGTGYVKSYCSVEGCDEVFAYITLPKLQHVFEETETKDPTCTSSGYTTYKCKTCNETYNAIGDDANGHKFTVLVSSTATCDAPGKMTLKCACGVTMTADVPALGHNYVENAAAATEATCAAPATKTYECSRCTASYTISVGDKSEAHSWNDWVTVEKATNTSLGYETRTCKICGKLEVQTIQATGEHSFTVETTDKKAPTCTESGYIVYACSTHANCGLTSTVTIPATGHTETLEYTPATCDAAGSTKMVCSVCDDTLKEKAISALGHLYGEGTVTNATCKAEGKIEYTCTRCNNATKTVTIPVDADAHKYTTTVTQADCENNGSVVTKCSICEDITTVTIPAKGHTWNAGEVTDEATCEQSGFRTLTCKNCGTTSEDIIPALGHVYEPGDAVAPTCTTSGYTVYTCKNDGAHTYKVYDESKPATGHSYAQVKDSSTATCTNSGTVTLKCADCGKEIKTAVPALGHSWGAWSTTKNPTATVEGEKARKCNNCDATETVTLPKLGHSMVVDADASTPATCEAEGEDVYVCTTHTGDAACGYTYTVKTAKLEHTYGPAVETAATCENDGEKVRTCNCGDQIIEIIPKTGHNLSTTVNSATCESAGSVVTVCTKGCGYSFSKDLPAVPHDLTVTTTKATCEADGSVVEACKTCDYEKTTTIEKLGHDFSGEENVVTDATCTADGSKTVKCTRCDKTTTVTIPMTAHNFVAGTPVEATCTTNAYIPYKCACGQEYKELAEGDPIGHRWNSGEITTPATCTTEGEITYTCLRTGCGATKTEKIAKFGHSWGAWYVWFAPTATADGVQRRDCIRDKDNCKAFETATIPALGGTTTYTVTFVADGTVVATQTVAHGKAATAPEISNREPNANGHYSYIWDKDFSKVTEDLTVNAVYTLANHNFGEWVIDSGDEATCIKSGTQYRDCKDCAYRETQAIPKKEHNYSEIIGQKAATCTESGYIERKCSVCGAANKQTVSRLGHAMTYHQYVAETCDTDGVMAYFSCSRCSLKFADKYGQTELNEVVIPKLYHTLVVVEGKAPTCASEGMTDYKYCTRCGFTQMSTPIPALGHVDVNNDNTCDRCGGTYMEDGVKVCGCSCHKNGTFNQLIYKILLFFWKLFGLSKSCECGRVHY